MESQLFTYAGGCDPIDNSFQFFDCTLIVDCGEYKVGTKFPLIEINIETMRLRLYHSGPDGTLNDEPTDIFALTVHVGPKVQLDESVNYPILSSADRDYISGADQDGKTKHVRRDAPSIEERRRLAIEQQEKWLHRFDDPV